MKGKTYFGRCISNVKAPLENYWGKKQKTWLKEEKQIKTQTRPVAPHRLFEDR